MTLLPLQLVVFTENPPVLGVWTWAKDWSDCQRLDRALHQASMQRWLALAKEQSERAGEP